MPVTWTPYALDPVPPLSQERIALVESRLGVTFPEDFLEVMREHQGSAPDREVLPLPGGDSTIFNSLVHFEDVEDGLGILELSERDDDGDNDLPAGYVPIATDPEDNLICYDFSVDAEDPSVVFWAYDEPGHPVSRLADSFTALLASLRDDDEDEDD